MNIENQRNAAIEVFCNSTLNYNLNHLPQINVTQLAQDLVDVCAFLSLYKTKHPSSTFAVDTLTSTLQKHQFDCDLANCIREFTPDELERTGALICHLFGSQTYYVTKKAHDQGIDFVAEQDISLFSTNVKNYIVGQSKNYSNGLVDVRDIRELAGAILLLRHKEFSQSLIAYKDVLISSITPVRGIFITSYYFSEFAQKLCSKCDIIPLDFLDILCILSSAAASGSIDIMTAGSFDRSKLNLILGRIIVLS